MKQLLNFWVAKQARTPGVIACGVRYPDETAYSTFVGANFRTDALENALRCLTNTFQVAQLNKFPSRRIRFVYENAFIYATNRSDGICLAIFTTRDPAALEKINVDQLLTEFHQLSKASALSGGGDSLSPIS